MFRDDIRRVIQTAIKMVQTRGYLVTQFCDLDIDKDDSRAEDMVKDDDDDDEEEEEEEDEEDDLIDQNELDQDDEEEEDEDGDLHMDDDDDDVEDLKDANKDIESKVDEDDEDRVDDDNQDDDDDDGQDNNNNDGGSRKEERASLKVVKKKKRETKKVREMKADRQTIVNSIVMQGFTDTDVSFAMVLFADRGGSLGIGTFRHCVDIIKEHGFGHVIFVTHEKWTPSAEDGLKQSPFSYEVFRTSFLSRSVVDHVLQPKFTRIVDEEAFLSAYGLTREQLPKMSPIDPVTRYYAFPIDTIVLLEYPEKEVRIVRWPSLT
jgi:DNA-directed RNA polymerase subunit H (RpoH/RPB5)